MTRVWLTGDLYDEAYLYDTATGDHRRYRTGQELGATAGNGAKLGRRFVATYLAPDGHDIVIQVGQNRYPLDGATRARARVSPGGIGTALVLERAGEPTHRLLAWTVHRCVSRVLDPTWDGLDEMVADRAAGIAALVNSSEARESYRRVKSPSAGPWHLVERQSP